MYPFTRNFKLVIFQKNQNVGGRNDKIWSRILFVLAILGCLATLCSILAIPAFAKIFRDFDSSFPDLALTRVIVMTSGVWIVLALPIVAVIPLLILTEIKTTDKRRCISTYLRTLLLTGLITAIIIIALFAPIFQPTHCY